MERAGERTTAMAALVAVALLVATTTLVVVTFATARAAGVIVAGHCGAYGQAYDFVNIEAARKSALEQCHGDCKVVAQVRRGCSALAVDGTNPCGASGSASGPRLGRVQNEALKRCYRAGGRDCVIRTFLCDAKG